MSWQIAALIACLTLCGAIEITRRARLDAFETLLYRAMIAGFMLLPFSMIMIWPRDPYFYIIVAGASLLAAYTGLVTSDLALKRNGRVAMMVQPLAIFFTFVGWLATTPGAASQISTAPTLMAITIACLVVIGLSLQLIRRNDYAWWALRAVLPVALGQAMLYVALKWFLADTGALIPLILTILMLQNFGMVLATPLVALGRQKHSEHSIHRFARFPLLPLAMIGILHTLSTFALLIAIAIADNPAYPVAMMALAPLVFYIYYWVRGWPDRASPWAGLALALAALTLGFLHA